MKKITSYSTPVRSYINKFLAAFTFILCTHFSFSQASANGPGWYLTGYSFKDGSLQKETELAGTTSKMKDVISFKGDKGNIEITQNRYDLKSGKLLAGVTYKVIWTDPPAVLKSGEMSSFDFELTTLSSLTWKVPQQSMHLNQSLNGVYFVTPDGTKYITKDIKSVLTTEKVLDKGTKGAKRVLQMNFGNGFSATYNYEWRENIPTEKQSVTEDKNITGWHMTNYSFKDGSLQKETVLAGTTSKMKDVISFKGDKGNIEITQNRYDLKSGKMLAGITYKVIWTDPPAVLKPEEKSSFDFELTTLSSLTWKVPQQSMHLNQSLNGVYFVTHDGTKYITKDIKSVLTTEKVLDKGTKGAKRVLQMNFGNGFSATYNYEWKEY